MSLIEKYGKEKWREIEDTRARLSTFANKARPYPFREYEPLEGPTIKEVMNNQLYPIKKLREMEAKINYTMKKVQERNLTDKKDSITLIDS